MWQQDRWSDGGARGLLTGTSFDGGRTWMRTAATFTRCSGGNAANGGDFERASDPWISFAPDGTVHQVALALIGQESQPGSVSAILASRSSDGGRTWSAPATVIRDGSTAFNDKEAITADSTDARFVYAVWDRLAGNRGPTYFGRSTDGGATWEVARPIHDPGPDAQTLNNQIVVLPDGTLVNFFTLFNPLPSLAVIRSADKGATWSPPIIIAAVQAVGAQDPETGTDVRDSATLGAIAVSRQGGLVASWQDARFAAGARDGIAVSRSSDGGLTWSAPVRINSDPGVQAFSPTVAVLDDGTIGVTYYDFRNNSSDRATLPTDLWLAQSNDGINWRETHVSGPFDLRIAPYARRIVSRRLPWTGRHRRHVPSVLRAVEYGRRRESHRSIRQPDRFAGIRGEGGPCRTRVCSADACGNGAAARDDAGTARAIAIDGPARARTAQAARRKRPRPAVTGAKDLR